LDKVPGEMATYTEPQEVRVSQLPRYLLSAAMVAGKAEAFAEMPCKIPAAAALAGLPRKTH
jgi:hypothetical protein